MGFDMIRDPAPNERLVVEVCMSDEIRDVGQWRNSAPASLLVQTARGSCSGLGAELE